MNISKLTTLLILLVLLGCEQTLTEELSAEKSQRVYLLLNNNNIRSTRTKSAENSWKISVAQQDYSKALDVLKSNYMLENRQADQSKVPSILSGIEERAVKLDRILAEQIENTLLKIPGVMEVRIHISPQTKFTELGSETNKFCAVMLFVNQDYQLANKKLKKFIGGATGIKASNIRVVTSLAEPIISENFFDAPLAAVGEVKQNNSYSKAIVFAGAGFILIGLALLVRKIVY